MANVLFNTMDTLPNLNELWNNQYIRSSDIKSFDYSHLPEPIKNGCSRQILWHLIHNITDIVRCECGNPVKWTTKYNNYRTYCSSKCSNSNINKKDKVKQTNIERYGVENPQQNKDNGWLTIQNI